MYRLGLIVCLVLSDVNVFLKLKANGESVTLFNGLISYFVYFALKAEEHVMFTSILSFIFSSSFFFISFLCIYCAGMNKM